MKLTRTWLLYAACLIAPLQIAQARGADAYPSISSGALPVEALQTLELIKKNGPFAYSQDGRVFGNREGLLPKRDRGYYREYTVKTPGARDRGARRIVAGQGGEYYYTADHYQSFRRIIE